MSRKTIFRYAVTAFLLTAAVESLWAQTPRPAVVPVFTGAASLKPDLISSGSIDWGKTLQEIDGFGGSGAFQMAKNLMDFPEPQRSEILDILFSKDKGAGLSIVRNIVGDGGTVGGASPTIEPKEGEWDWSVDKDQLWLMQEAGKRGCTRFMSTVWSPPAWMKDNNNVVGGHLRRDKYQAFAEYLSMYIRGYKEHHGIELYAISLANEPDVNVRYSSCYWTGQEFHDFLKILIPVFERDKIKTKVIVGEHSAWTENLVLESLADSVTAARIDIVGVHAYHTADNDPFPPVSQRSGQLIETMAQKKKIWQTEVSNLGRNYPDIRDGLYWAKVIHTHISENNANAWLYWWVVTFPNSGQGMVHLDPKTKTYTVDKRLYTMGNFSRFVKPGYFRIQTNMELSPGILVSAYKSDSEKKLVIVAINENAGDRGLEIKLAGVNASSATSWRTSETENLAGLPEITVIDNTLKTTLAPGSVTTFVLSAH